MKKILAKVILDKIDFNMIKIITILNIDAVNTKIKT